MTTVRLPENVAKLLSSTVVIESGVIKDFTRKWKKKTSQLKDLQKKLTKLYKE